MVTSGAIDVHSSPLLSRAFPATYVPQQFAVLASSELGDLLSGAGGASGREGLASEGSNLIKLPRRSKRSEAIAHAKWPRRSHLNKSTAKRLHGPLNPNLPGR